MSNRTLMEALRKIARAKCKREGPDEGVGGGFFGPCPCVVCIARAALAQAREAKDKEIE